jgi:hypothetical protein
MSLIIGGFGNFLIPLILGTPDIAYSRINKPQFRSTKIRFSGMDSEAIETLGEFWIKIAIDSHIYPIHIRIVSNTMLRQKLLFETDFLDAEFM